MLESQFPRMMTVRQAFPVSLPLEIRAALQREFAPLRKRVKPGARIAVAVGSRGIANLQEIVMGVVEGLKGEGAEPFIVPAMGSHGGATPDGQKELLSEYGITEERLKVPIHAAMETERLGTTEEGLDVFFSTEARRADGIVVVNRIKPHTDFSSDSLGSGLLKLMVIGLGKRTGAANYHASASRFGYEHVLRAMARVVLRAAPILGGVALVENQRHETVRIAVLAAEEIQDREERLYAEAKQLMPKLPFDDIDLLIVDRLGKNISGAGMDPNVIGRGVHGYFSLLGQKPGTGPSIRRLFVRDLTPETHGNAIGVGMADFTTSRLVRAMDSRITYINSLTSLTPHCAKVPIHFETDRETIERALASLALDDVSNARVVRIADTLSLETLEVSAAFHDQLGDGLKVISGTREMAFDAAGNLLPLAHS